MNRQFDIQYSFQHHVTTSCHRGMTGNITLIKHLSRSAFVKNFDL